MTEEEKSNSTDTGAYLIVNSQIFHLKHPVTSVGRMLDNDLVIQEPLISRHHAQIHFDGDQYHIEDLNSTSGTFLNNKKVPNGILYSGDIILLANIPIMFVDETTNISANAEEATGKLHD